MTFVVRCGKWKHKLFCDSEPETGTVAGERSCQLSVIGLQISNWVEITLDQQGGSGALGVGGIVLQIGGSVVPQFLWSSNVLLAKQAGSKVAVSVNAFSYCGIGARKGWFMAYHNSSDAIL